MIGVSSRLRLLPISLSKLRGMTVDSWFEWRWTNLSGSLRVP